MLSTNVTGAAAYAAIQKSSRADSADTDTANEGSFGAALQDAISGLTALGQDADAKSAQALRGTGSLTDVVTAVSKAEMALQASVAVRDKMISAYQDIMRMSV